MGSSPFFQLGETILQSDSTINLMDIGEGVDALKCVTSYNDCCKQQKKGEYYYPDTTPVGVRKSLQGMYRNRAEGYIKLNRRANRIPPVGRYSCVIPDKDGNLKAIFINIQ